MIAGSRLGDWMRSFFIHLHAAQDDFDVARGYAEFLGQKSHHVVGRSTRARSRGGADLELRTFRLAENIEHQCLAIPIKNVKNDFAVARA